MASEDLGLRIRRARERKRWTQLELAEAMPPDSQGRRPGVRSVGRWERGDTVPRNAIGALEEVLGISLDDTPEPEEIYTDPAEAELWALDRFTAEERRELIRVYRERRLDRAG